MTQAIQDVYDNRRLVNTVTEMMGTMKFTKRFVEYNIRLNVQQDYERNSWPEEQQYNTNLLQSAEVDNT